MRPDDGAEIDRLLDLFQEWQKRITTPRLDYNTPRRGGALLTDQALPNGALPCHLAWRAMAAGCEHLGFIVDHLKSTGDEVRAKPFAVLARASMLGAAKCVYLLELASAQERRRRSLKLLTGELDNTKKVLSDMKLASAEDMSADRPQAEKKLQQMLDACGQALVAEGYKERTGVSETQLLEAVSHVLDIGKGNPALGVLNFWRYTSGVAHSMSWHWDLLPEDEDPSQQLAYTIGAPGRLMEKAWELWELRRAE
jgi:hypothetical protein